MLDRSNKESNSLMSLSLLLFDHCSKTLRDDFDADRVKIRCTCIQKALLGVMYTAEI